MRDKSTTPTQPRAAVHREQSTSHPSAISAKTRRHGFSRHGYLGLAIILISQVLMFARIEPFYTWFTSIQWTGYILFLDAILMRWRGESYIFGHTKEFIFLALVSIACWFLFEAYNLHLRNWQYHNLPENLLRRLFALFWAFATIFPAILMTSEVVDHLGIFQRARFSPLAVPQWVHPLFFILGALFCIVPALVPATIAKYLFAFVWMGYVFWLDPINCRLGLPSLLRDLENGSLQKLLSLFLAGSICGILWEFWNYWAGAKWVYTVPFWNKPKIFEMPLIGFLGFLPFAAECFVMWQLALYFWKRGENNT